MLAEDLGIDVRDLGSTAFRREDLDRGFEPDSRFYVQNQERTRGKDRIDLVIDPPPDLVIEIDITSPSLDKHPIHARLGVPEVWRYDGGRVTILRLEGTDYAGVVESMALPPLADAVLSRFVQKGKSMRRTVWLREISRVGARVRVRMLRSTSF